MQEVKLRQLRRGCARSRIDFDDLLRACREGYAQFHDAEGACAITSVSVSGSNKVCIILVAAGTLYGLRQLEPAIERFAREQGCQAIQTIGRPGFERVYTTLADGYKPIGMMYEKALENTDG